MKKFFRNKMESIGSLLQPLLWLMIFSVGMSSFMSDTNMPYSYLTFVLPGMIGFTLVSACINGGTSWINDKTNGIIKTYQVAPISRFSPLIANILSIFSKALLQGIVIIVVGLILGATLKLSVVGFILSIVLIGLFIFAFSGVALYFASKSPNSSAYHMVIFIFQMPLLFLSNALYSLNTLPTVLKVFANLNPMTYLISGIRMLLFDSVQISLSSLIVQIVVLAGFAIFGLLIAKRAYAKIIWEN